MSQREIAIKQAVEAINLASESRGSDNYAVVCALVSITHAIINLADQSQ